MPARFAPLHPLCPQVALLGLLVSLVLAPVPAVRGQTAPNPATAAASAGGQAVHQEWRLMEGLYQEGDLFRAESEALRWLQRNPAAPGAAEVRLLQAKLYYRAGRFQEAELMLYALLDRHREGDAAREARRLLAFSVAQLGRSTEALSLLRTVDGPVGQTAGQSTQQVALEPPEAALADAEAAQAWSTALPGSGFFTLGQPGKGAAAVTANLVLIGGAVLAWQQNNPGAALVLLLAEGALWQGGRQAVVQEAARQNAETRQAWRQTWLAAQGEPELLRVGLNWRFGGP